MATPISTRAALAAVAAYLDGMDDFVHLVSSHDLLNFGF
jgi:hypothetical protein